MILRILTLLLLIAVIPSCSAKNTSEGYEREFEQLLSEGRYEDGKKLVIKWNEEIPEDGEKIKALYNRLLAEQRSSPAGAGGISVSTFNQMITQAAIDGDLVEMRELLSTNPEKTIQESQGGHPLLLASYFGHADIVRELLSHGVDVNYQDQAGTHALIHAVMGKRIEIIELLLDSGADVNLETKRGSNALVVARGGVDIAVQEIIVDAGGKIGSDPTKRVSGEPGAVHKMP